jgi:hypothetical protein
VVFSCQGNNLKSQFRRLLAAVSSQEKRRLKILSKNSLVTTRLYSLCVLLATRIKPFRKDVILIDHEIAIAHMSQHTFNLMMREIQKY